MGEFVRTYGYDSKLSDEYAEKTMQRLVKADAINQGFTPDGDAVLTWNAVTRRVKATLPVVERTVGGR